MYIIKKIDKNCTVIHDSFQLTNKNIKLCEKMLLTTTEIRYHQFFFRFYITNFLAPVLNNL